MVGNVDATPSSRSVRLRKRDEGVASTVINQDVALKASWPEQAMLPEGMATYPLHRPFWSGM